MVTRGLFTDFHAALMRLSHSTDFISESRNQKLAALTRFCAARLGVDRVSVWQLSHGHDRIICEWLNDASTAAEPRESAVTDKPASVVELLRRDHPAYFEALMTARVIDAVNARTDSRTRSFADSYLMPRGIHSLLDAPVFDGARLSGAICLETRQPRHWSLPELSCVVAVADTISLINTHEAWLSSKEKLDFLTRYDSFTGLPNLDSLRERLGFLINKSRRESNDGFCLFWADLDRLKVINDGLGSQVGDEVIAEVGRRLKDIPLDGKDLLARIGGDEYALVVRSVQSNTAIDNTATRILSEIARPVNASGHLLNISASIGIALFPADGSDAETLLRSAEAAMYHAKSTGKSRACRFDNSIQATARSRFALERELLDAIRNETLDVFYQPIFDHTGKVLVSAEALVRWNHPEQGWLSPLDFLEIARGAGLMYELGECVIRAVCRHVREARQTGSGFPVISVNLSAEQVLSPELPTLVESVCREFDVPQNCLHFEVTEDSIQGDSTTLRRTLSRLVEAGSELAIDDFGTGYSSLARLKALPFSKLKIDRSFIHDIPYDEDDCAITLSIIGLARGLGLSVVAEGVEYQEHERWLQVQGCEMLQGYLYSEPVPFQTLQERFVKPAADSLSGH